MTKDRDMARELLRRWQACGSPRGDSPVLTAAMAYALLYLGDALRVAQPKDGPS